jgi:hypothetical protein
MFSVSAIVAPESDYDADEAELQRQVFMKKKKKRRGLSM